MLGFSAVCRSLVEEDAICGKKIIFGSSGSKSWCDIIIVYGKVKGYWVC